MIVLHSGQVSKLGRRWQKGRPIPNDVRLKIIEMAAEGYGVADISNELKITKECVRSIIEVRIAVFTVTILLLYDTKFSRQ